MAKPDKYSNCITYFESDTFPFIFNFFQFFFHVCTYNQMVVAKHHEFRNLHCFSFSGHLLTDQDQQKKFDSHTQNLQFIKLIREKSNKIFYLYMFLFMKVNFNASAQCM